MKPYSLLSRIIPDFNVFWRDAARMPFIPLGIALFCGIISGESSVALIIAKSSCIIGLAGFLVMLTLRLMSEANTNRPLHAVHLWRYRLRHAVWFPMFLLVYAGGNFWLRIYGQHDLECFDTGGRLACGVVEELHAGAAAERAVVRVDSYVEQDGKRMSIPPFKVMLHADALPCGIGDRIIFPGSLDTIAKSPAPEVFDYKAYLYSHGIDFTAYTSADRVKTAGREYGLKFMAGELRDRMSGFIYTTGLSNVSKQIVAAILLGDSDALDYETRRQFAGAGIAHILAISGLHVGIIALLISYIFLPIELLSSRRIRYLLTIPAILAFAFITGLSPSVTRASIMSICVITALLLERKSNSLNLLALAAFIMLCIDPRFAFDTGFRLSFLATFCVITLCPLLTAPIKNTWLRTMTAYCCVPVIIFLVTWPLSASSFHEISLLFLPANIILLPLLPVFFSVVILYLVLCSMGCDISFLASLINRFCDALIEGSGILSGEEVAHLPLYQPEFLLPLYILILAIATYAILRNSSKAFVVAGSTALLTGGLLLYSGNLLPTDRWILNHTVHRCSITTMQHGRVSYLNNEAGTNALMRCAGEYIVWLDNNTLDTAIAQGHKFKCDALIIGSKFRGKVEDIFLVFAPRRVILHNSMNSEFPDLIREMCSRYKIAYFDFRDEESLTFVPFTPTSDVRSRNQVPQ